MIALFPRILLFAMAILRLVLKESIETAVSIGGKQSIGIFIV